MPVGESSKRRQLRGATFSSTVRETLNLTTPTVTTVPPEASHVRVFNESSTNTVRFGFDNTVDSNTGHIVMFRVPTDYPLPPSCAVISACRLVTGTSFITYQFYGVGSQL